MNSPDEEPKGVVVTIREIYNEVSETSSKLVTLDTKLTNVLQLRSNVDENESRIRKLEVQNAAHWVVHTLTVGGIAVAIGRMFENVG